MMVKKRVSKPVKLDFIDMVFAIGGSDELAVLASRKGKPEITEHLVIA